MSCLLLLCQVLIWNDWKYRVYESRYLHRYRHSLSSTLPDMTVLVTYYLTSVPPGFSRSLPALLLGSLSGVAGEDVIGACVLKLWRSCIHCILLTPELFPCALASCRFLPLTNFQCTNLGSMYSLACCLPWPLTCVLVLFHLCCLPPCSSVLQILKFLSAAWLLAMSLPLDCPCTFPLLLAQVSLTMCRVWGS